MFETSTDVVILEMLTGEKNNCWDKDPPPGFAAHANQGEKILRRLANIWNISATEETSIILSVMQRHGYI